MSNPLQPILISGLPRSGTTWNFNVLSQADQTLSVFEPDNQALNPYGLSVQLDMHRFPSEDDVAVMPHLEEFWDQIFMGGWKTGYIFLLLKKIYLGNLDRIEAQIERAGGKIIPPNRFTRYVLDHSNQQPITRTILIDLFSPLMAETNPTGKRVIVKSVHSVRQLRWITEKFKPRTVLITRGLPNLIASYIRLQMPDSLRGITASAAYAEPVARLQESARPGDETLFHEIIIQACELTRMLIDFQASNRDTILIKHEEACLDPSAHFRSLFDQLELPWNTKISAYIDSVNKPGNKQDNFRIAEQEAHRHQDQLSVVDLEIIRAYAEIYDLTEYS